MKLEIVKMANEYQVKVKELYDKPGLNQNLGNHIHPIFKE